MAQQSQLQPAQREVFIVRIWREKDTTNWRGSVQHTRSGESIAFCRMSELQAFIESRAGEVMLEHPKGLK